MKREAKKDTTSLVSSPSSAVDARNNMIGEIENRSSFMLAVRICFFMLQLTSRIQRTLALRKFLPLNTVSFF